jgi:hypothetical protein
MAAKPASDDSSQSQRDRQARERDLMRELQEASGRSEPPPREGTADEKERKDSRKELP